MEFSSARKVLSFRNFITDKMGAAVAQWLRCCAANRKGSGSSLLLAVVECGRFVVKVLYARSVVLCIRLFT